MQSLLLKTVLAMLCVDGSTKFQSTKQFRGFKANVKNIPPLILTNMSVLKSIRKRIASRDDTLAHAAALLKIDAEDAMTAQSWTEGAGPWSVMNQSAIAPSHNRHDYFSTAKYCWPCNTICNATIENITGNDCKAWKSGSDYHPQKCNNSTGLPWLCHDGYANPINDHLGRGLWDSLYYTVPTLALSAFMTDNATQARRAALLTRTWFVEESSRMNPNLEFAQAIPGINNGTGGGIIDFSDHHKLLDILDAMTMLQASSDTHVSQTWSESDAEALRQWVIDFKVWLNASHHAHQEQGSSNNHGTWFDVMASGLAVYTKDTQGVRQLCDSFLRDRLAVQVQPAGASVEHGGPNAGALPMEDSRTNSQSYHSMDADGLLILAQLCAQTPNAPDVIHTSTPCFDWKKRSKHKWYSPCKDNSSLRVTLADVPDWAAPYAANVTAWPFRQITSYEYPYYWAHVFRRAANLFHNATYERIVQGLPDGGVAPKYILDLIEPYVGPDIGV